MCKPGLVKENKSKRNHVYERVIDRLCVRVYVCLCVSVMDNRRFLSVLVILGT